MCAVWAACGALKYVWSLRIEFAVRLKAPIHKRAKIYPQRETAGVARVESDSVCNDRFEHIVDWSDTFTCQGRSLTV